jgi:hypothetical protein
MPDHEIGPTPLISRECNLPIALQLEPMAVHIVPNVAAHGSTHLINTVKVQRDAPSGVPQAAKLELAAGRNNPDRGLFRHNG